jgi:hypothetical protein
VVSLRHHASSLFAATRHLGSSRGAPELRPHGRRTPHVLLLIFGPSRHALLQSRCHRYTTWKRCAAPRAMRSRSSFDQGDAWERMRTQSRPRSRYHGGNWTHGWPCLSECYLQGQGRKPAMLAEALDEFATIFIRLLSLCAPSYQFVFAIISSMSCSCTSLL